MQARFLDNMVGIRDLSGHINLFTKEEESMPAEISIPKKRGKAKVKVSVKWEFVRLAAAGSGLFPKTGLPGGG
jgi:hypothetical protein